MEREDFVGIGERSLARLRSRTLRPEEVRTYVIRTTSGTTGKQPLIVARKMKPGLFRMFDGLVRPVVCMGAMNARLTNVLAARYLESDAPVRVMSIDGRDL